MFTAAWFSCFTKGNRARGLQEAIKKGATVFFSQGDAPYCNTSSSNFGFTASTVDKDTTVAQFITHHDQHHATPDVAAMLAAKTHYYIMPDDHEWGGDNWDHTITQANTQTSIGAVTQADADAHWDAGRQAVTDAIATYADNPVNSDSGATADKPSESAEADGANYPVMYFRQGFDINGNTSTAPHIEFFNIDCISYRDPIADTDNASKTMLGANQKAWLKAQLLASSATFKVIVSNKKTYATPTNDNTDTWGEYTTERDEMLTYIASNSLTGIMWLSGDRHYPHVIKTSISGGDTYDHYCFCACPISIDTNSIGIASEVVWDRDAQVVGVLNIYEDYIEPLQVDVATGEIHYRGRLPAGSNKEVFTVLSVAI